MDLLSKNVQFLNEYGSEYEEKTGDLLANVPMIFEVKDGEIHLDGRPFYGEDLNSLIDRQIDEFTNDDSHYDLSIHDNPRDDFIEYNLDSLLYSKFSDSNTISPCKDRIIPILIVFGVGAGRHLTRLVEQFNIRRLVIVEPNPEIFRASLEVFDWKEFSLLCDEKGTQIDFNMHQNPHVTWQMLKGKCIQWGFHSYINMHTFVHYRNNRIEEQIDTYAKDCKHLTSSDGFFGDERLGLAHCAGNVSKSYSMLVNTNKVPKFPALIVGNGPSLNNDIEFIKENKDKILVCSCGSTLYTLHKHGITPHVHFEMERSHDTLALLRDNLPKKYLKSINLVTLCTSHPDISKLFKRTYLVAKDVDINLPYLNSLVGPELAVPRFMNPVVANFCFSFLSSCNFKEIYLAGVDSGTIDLNVHHAKGSQYDEGAENRLEFDNKFCIKTEGNFGGEAYTTSELQKSAMSFSVLVEENKGKYTKLVNMSDGIKIESFEAVRSSDVELRNIAITPKTLNSFFKNRFKKGLIGDKVKSTVRTKLAPSISALLSLKFPKECPKDEEELLGMLDQRVKMLQTLDYMNYRLVGGMINHFNLVISIIMFNRLSQDRWTEATTAMNESIDANIELFDKHLYNLDWPEVKASYSG